MRYRYMIVSALLLWATPLQAQAQTPEDEARALERSLVQVEMDTARASGSWRTVVAPPGEHRPLHEVGFEMIRDLLHSFIFYVRVGFVNS